MLVALKNNNESLAAVNVQNFHNSFFRYLDVMPNTAKTYRAGIKAFFEYMASQGTNKPCRQTVIDFRVYLLEAGKTAGTVATYLQAVKSFSAWLADNELYPSDFARKVKAPRQSQISKKDALSAPQLKDVLSCLNGDTEQALRDRAIVTLLACCGLRAIEASRATIDDIRNKDGQFVLYVQGKGHCEKDCFVPVPKAAIEAINRYLEARGKAPKNAPLFASISTNGTAGKALSTRSISGICKAALVRAGFKSQRITAHSLRHSVATACLKAGNTAHEVQLYLRHSNINTTMIYAHEVEQANNTCAQTMQSLLF